MIGDRIFSKGIILLHLLKRLFDQDLRLVKQLFLNNYTNYNNINDTHVRVNKKVIRIPYDNAPIHINFDASYPITK